MHPFEQKGIHRCRCFVVGAVARSWNHMEGLHAGQGFGPALGFGQRFPGILFTPDQMNGNR